MMRSSPTMILSGPAEWAAHDHTSSLPWLFILTPFECIRGHLHFLMVNPCL